jgi:hypothetical protein
MDILHIELAAEMRRVACLCSETQRIGVVLPSGEVVKVTRDELRELLQTLRQFCEIRREFYADEETEQIRSA